MCTLSDREIDPTTYAATCIGCGVDHPAGPACPARPQHVDHRGPLDCAACDLEQDEMDAAATECGACGDPLDGRDGTLPRDGSTLYHDQCIPTREI